jgi:hypothetical protein
MHQASCRHVTATPEGRRARAILHLHLTFEPREIDAFVAKLDPRRELVFRIAIADLCDRCRCDRKFKQRTEELMQRFNGELNAVLIDAGKLAADLTRH